MSSKTDTDTGPDKYPRDHLIFLMGMTKALCFSIRACESLPRLQEQAVNVETFVDRWLVDMGMIEDGGQET